MDTIKYRDGSAAKIARYVVGDVGEQSCLDFGLNRRKAVAFAQRETDFYKGNHSSLSVMALGPDGVPYAIWNVAYGSVGRRIDP